MSFLLHKNLIVDLPKYDKLISENFTEFHSTVKHIFWKPARIDFTPDDKWNSCFYEFSNIFSRSGSSYEVEKKWMNQSILITHQNLFVSHIYILLLKYWLQFEQSIWTIIWVLHWWIEYAFDSTWEMWADFITQAVKTDWIKDNMYTKLCKYFMACAKEKESWWWCIGDEELEKLKIIGAISLTEQKRANELEMHIWQLHDTKLTDVMINILFFWEEVYLCFENGNVYLCDKKWMENLLIWSSFWCTVVSLSKLCEEIFPWVLENETVKKMRIIIEKIETKNISYMEKAINDLRKFMDEIDREKVTIQIEWEHSDTNLFSQIKQTNAYGETSLKQYKGKATWVSWRMIKVLKKSKK